MTEPTAKSLQPMKATAIDDDAFRLLAIPYGGPIPSPVSPIGVDRDGEWFSSRTDIKPHWFSTRVVDWHHRTDKRVGNAVIGKAVDLEEDEDGWWVKVWLNRQAAELRLVEKLVARGGQLFGSSESAKGMTEKADTGEILQWPYLYQTLSPTPRNILSVIRPLKATLHEYSVEGIPPTASFFEDLAGYLDDLATRPSDDLTGESDAKAGRVLAARNEVRLREMRESLATGYSNPRIWKQAIAAIDSVLTELEQMTTIPAGPRAE